MQTVSANFQAEIVKGQFEPVILVDLFEFYAHDAVPGVNGFDPADATETFASQEITWDGTAYRRLVKSRSEITKNVGEKVNSVTVNFSNVDRYAATWAQTTTIEGMMCVIRCVNPDVTDGFSIEFIGRCDKPGDIDKGDFSLTIRQDFGDINVTLPTAQYVADDPNGLLPDNPLYEGIRFVPLTGLTPPTTSTVPSTSFFGKLFGRKKKVTTTSQWSSLDATPYGQPIKEVFGRCQIEAEAIMFKDTGFWLEGLWAWCKGPISTIENIALKNFSSYGLFDVQTHTGELGGTGDAIVRTPLVPQIGGNVTEDFRFPGSGLFSLLSFSGLSILQSGLNDEPVVIDEPPVIVGLVLGRKVPLPDTSGVYGAVGWSDNPVHISRFILINSRFCRINSGFMEDSVNYQTSLHCDEPLIDDSNGETIVMPSVETGQTGAAIRRYRSSGVINTRRVLYYDLGDTSEVPETVDGPYTDYDETAIPESFASQPVLRKRYTANFPVTEEVKATDLLNKTVYPTAKLFPRVNARGKIEIHTEKPSSHTLIRTATVVGATSLLVLDVTPWKTGAELLTGRLFTGVGLTTSEVRDLTSADFSTSGNSITLTAGDTGTTTLTASGATLSGGSTSAQASGTVTVGGTPAAGDTITATIDGVAVVYTLNADDTTGSAAAILAARINATVLLQPHIKAFWVVASPTVVTIKCLHGALNLSSSTGFSTLLKAHDVGEEVVRIAGSLATNSQDVYSAWSASTLVLLNDIYLPTVLNGHKYQVTTGGTTGTSEPTWPTTAGGTVASGTAVFTEIGSTVLAQAGLSRSNVLKDSLKWPLGSTQSSVNQVKGNFRSAKDDFALIPFKVNDGAHQAQVKKIFPLEADFSAVDNWHQTFRLAKWLLSKHREGDWFISCGTGPQGLVYEEGDLVTVSDDSGGLVNVLVRIEELRIRQNHEVLITRARLYSTNMFSDDVTATVIPIPSTLRRTQTADSLIEFIDTPAIRDSEGLVPGFKVAVSRDLSIPGDWRGWSLYADYGDGYIKIAQGDIAAKVGETDSTLDDVADTSVFDNTNELDFTLKYGPPPPAPAPFASVSEAELLLNPLRNLFLVGDEYIQAATIVDNGNQSYTISDLLHGRFETECVDHAIGERVVYIDGSEVFVSIDMARIGIEYPYKAVTTNQDISEATPVLFTWLGNILKDRKVTELNAVRDPSGNWHVSAIGHPRQLPAYYNARIRRPVDDVIMRDIPIATGLTQAAIFGDTFGQILVTNNNLSTTPTLTFTTDVATNEELTAVGHTFVVDDKVRVSNTGGGLPAPLLVDTTYFVESVSGDDLTLSATLGGAAINLTTNGTGTHSIKTAPFIVMGARTTQEITEPGAFLEFVLPALDQFAGGSLNLGLFHSADPDWTDTSAWTVGVYTVRLTVLNVTTGEWAMSFWDVGGEDAGEILLSSYSLGLGAFKIRLTFSGTELRVYKNWANSSTAPIVISKVPPAEHFPLKAAFYLATGAVNNNASRIQQAVIGGMVNPSTIYSKAQQDADDPVTDMASIDVEMWQVSTVEGRKVRDEFP